MVNPIQNRNLLSPTGFNFIILKAREIDFFSQAASIPQISMNSATQATSLRNVPVPGDELYYGDFTLRFMVDEDMTSYIAVHNWIRALGFPVNRDEYDFEEKDSLYQKSKYYSNVVSNLRLREGMSLDMNFETSDASLQILNSSYNVARTVTFYDLFPVSLSTLEFRADDPDVQYLSADASFKYLYYDIK